VTGNLFWVLGTGSTDFVRTDQRDAFDLKGASGSTKPPLPVTLSSLAAATLGGRVYVIGGIATGTGIMITSETRVLDPLTASLVSVAPMKTPRFAMGAAAIGGRILRAGRRRRVIRPAVALPARPTCSRCSSPDELGRALEHVVARGGGVAIGAAVRAATPSATGRERAEVAVRSYTVPGAVARAGRDLERHGPAVGAAVGAVELLHGGRADRIVARRAAQEDVVRAGAVGRAVRAVGRAGGGSRCRSATRR
jgi:hypothetical protein